MWAVKRTDAHGAARVRARRTRGRSGAVARCVLCLLIGLGLGLGPLAARQLRAAAVLARLTSAPLPAAIARLTLSDIMESASSLPGSEHEVRARRYVASAARPGARPAVLLLHGAHARGIAEPRLQALARALAAAGLDVLTPELSALRDLRLEAGVSAEIRTLAAQLAMRAQTRAVAVIGISFAGGLALLAAAEQGSARAPIGCVVAVGAHHDLTRVGEYYARREVRGPDGERPDTPPHPYGARVLLRSRLGQLVPESDLPGAERALDTYLRDRHGEARELASRLSPAAQRVMRVVLDERGSTELDEYVLQAAQATRSQLTAASPAGRLHALRVPVLLIHGAGDPIVPSLETRYLARELPPAWRRSALITPLLRHAEFPEPPTLQSAWPVVSFMRRLLECAGQTTR